MRICGSYNEENADVDFYPVHCAITGPLPVLRMRHRPSARRLYRFGKTRPFSHLG